MTKAHEFKGTEECSLFNSEHRHSDGMSWVLCSCGWKSNPIRASKAELIWQTHVQQEMQRGVMKSEPELRLAFQTGALYIINKQMLPELDDAARKKMMEEINQEFERWLESMRPLFQMVGNSV